MAPRKRLSRQRSKGQSLPLIALMIVVLVAMVGLSVDVGNTFQEERQAVSAANAASLAGMNTVIRAGQSTTSAQVYNSIVNSLRSNGVEVAADGVAVDGKVRLDATYIDAQGKAIGSITANGGALPPNVAYIQINLTGIVNTSFAQVVGRPDLPINASSYAGQCALGDGVYPIVVKQSILDANGFVQTQDADGDGLPDDNWRVLQSGPYRGYTARRIFVHEPGGISGNFGFIRWKEDKGQLGKAATSAQELQASVGGFGNLSWGFDEAPEPSNVTPTEGYPIRPGELNEGDWVHVTPGWKAGGQEDEIAEHIRVGTRMVLPLYDQTSGNGSNGSFRITGFGSFVIIATNGKDDDLKGNGDKYFEMVYLGPAKRQTTACQFSPVPPNDEDCCELWGDVSFWPEYQIIPNDTQPIQYVVVLDQSGSMSANFNGQCNHDSTGNPRPPARNFFGQPSEFWQCSNGPLYDTNGDGVGDTAVTDRVTGTGQKYYWQNRDERRITVAKKALETLIRLTNMPGNAGYKTAYPDDQMALVWFTDTVQRNGNNEVFTNGTAFTNNRDELITKMWNRSTGPGGDIYRTQGGTNAAAGLYRAGMLLDAAPKSIVHTNGRSYNYKRIVLFITDGVSNQFFHASSNDLRIAQSNENSYPNGHPCRALGDLVIEDAECQTTAIGGKRSFTIGGTNEELDRPVTQAVRVSQDILQKNGYAVFVVALSDLPATGLSGGIPSFPNYYKAVPRLVVNGDGTTNVDTIVREINGIVENGRCQPGKDPGIATKITASQFMPVLLGNGSTLSYPNVGLVTVRNTTTGTSYSTFITAASDGRLSYKFAKVPPGIYTMTATVYYKHPNEPAGVNNRAYQDFFNGSDPVPSISIEVTNKARAGSFLPATQKNIDMRLRGNVCEGL